MKLAPFLVPLIFSCLAAASFFGAQTVLDDSDLSVPGDNPLEYCKATDDDKLIIDYVDLDPNPPKA